MRLCSLPGQALQHRKSPRPNFHREFTLKIKQLKPSLIAPHTICTWLGVVVVVVVGMHAKKPLFVHVMVPTSCFRWHFLVNGSKLDAAHPSFSRQAAQHSSLLCKTTLCKSFPSRTVSDFH